MNGQPFSEKEARLQDWLDGEYLWRQFNNQKEDLSMGMWPSEIRDERKMAPAGWVLFSIDKVERSTIQAQNVEKAVEKVYMTVQAPEAFEGVNYEETFWLGTDQDPLAQNPETLQRGGASKFKTFAAAANVAIEGQDEDLVRSQLKDMKVLGHIQHKVSAAGFVNPRAISWHVEGEKEPVADEAAMAAAREQANNIQANGTAQRGQGTLPPRFANGPARTSGAPLPPARPAGAPSAGPRLSGR